MLCVHHHEHKAIFIFNKIFITYPKKKKKQKHQLELKATKWCYRPSQRMPMSFGSNGKVEGTALD